MKFQRIVTALDFLKNNNNKLLYLFTLHSDLNTTSGGGTEGHVRQLRKFLLHENNAVLLLTPIRRKRGFVLRGFVGVETFLVEFFQDESLPNVITVLEQYVDKLHVHHAWKWPAVALDALANSVINTKIVTAHDFWFLCPSIHLLTGHNPEWFCEVESDMKKCNTCLATKWRHPRETIQGYRAISHDFLEHFDVILFPSASMLPYFKKAYSSGWASLASKIKLLPHDLSYLLPFEARESKNLRGTTKRFCFIGALDSAKGSQLLIDAIPELQQLGFEIEVLGSVFPLHHPHLKSIKIRPYKTPQELFHYLSENGGPDFLGYVSIGAETFSYTFYEGLLLSSHGIPVVSPFGNPAEICKAAGIGPVMEACTSAALIKAVGQADALRDQYYKKRQEFTKNLREKISHESYVTEYLNATQVDAKAIIHEPLTQEFLSRASLYDEQLWNYTKSFRGKLQWRIRQWRRIADRMSRYGFKTTLRNLLDKFI